MTRWCLNHYVVPVSSPGGTRFTQRSPWVHPVVPVSPGGPRGFTRWCTRVGVTRPAHLRLLSPYGGTWGGLGKGQGEGWGGKGRGEGEGREGKALLRGQGGCGQVGRWADDQVCLAVTGGPTPGQTSPLPSRATTRPLPARSNHHCRVHTSPPTPALLSSCAPVHAPTSSPRLCAARCHQMPGPVPRKGRRRVVGADPRAAHTGASTSLSPGLSPTPHSPPLEERVTSFTRPILLSRMTSTGHGQFGFTGTGGYVLGRILGPALGSGLGSALEWLPRLKLLPRLQFFLRTLPFASKCIPGSQQSSVGFIVYRLSPGSPAPMDSLSQHVQVT